MPRRVTRNDVLYIYIVRHFYLQELIIMLYFVETLKQYTMKLLELDLLLNNFSDTRLVYDNHRGIIEIDDIRYQFDVDIDVRFIEVANYSIVVGLMMIEYKYEVKHVNVLINDVYEIDNNIEVSLTTNQYYKLEALIIEEVENAYE